MELVEEKVEVEKDSPKLDHIESGSDKPLDIELDSPFLKDSESPSGKLNEQDSPKPKGNKYIAN